MSSSFKFVQNMEWCTLLPSPDVPRKSPVFSLQGNEWFFNFLYEKALNTWYYDVYLELYKKRTEIKETSVNFQIGFQKEQNLSLKTGEFKISEHREVWYMSVGDLQAKLPSDYLDGNWIKFLFFFNGVDQPQMKMSEKTGEKSVQTPSYIDTCFLMDSLSEKFSDMLNESPWHDLEFVCGEEKLNAHKCILSSRSDVFASMLQSNMVEGKTGRVAIEDMDATLFRQFLRYVYTGILPTLSVDVGLQFYKAADKYNISPLKKQCTDFLTDNLSHENVYDILIFSDHHNDQDFKKHALDYMIKEQMPCSGEKWIAFCKEYPILANEVLNLFCQRLLS